MAANDFAGQGEDRVIVVFGQLRDYIDGQRRKQIAAVLPRTVVQEQYHRKQEQGQELHQYVQPQVVGLVPVDHAREAKNDCGYQ